jgi:glycosyltransferase involved in cell wall biosynthesis
MPVKPVTLMLTPVLPSPTGGGSHMRAAALLECLCSRGPVIVVHAECWGPTPDVADRSWARARAAALIVIQPHRLAALPAIVRDTLAVVNLGPSVDTLFVFRDVVAPIGLRCAERLRPRVMLLDLDDDEADLAPVLASLRRARGEYDVAESFASMMQRRTIARAMFVPRFDHVFLANPRDVGVLRARHPHTPVSLLPNVLPPVTRPSGIARDPRTLLFLGTLSYLPNEDGVGYFIRDMWPLIRAQWPQARLRIVGAGLPERPSLLAADGVDLIGAVADVGPEFARAGQLVVPLRAGSGTRIKILEAFRYGTPVVSTTVGAAGLGVSDGDQALIADTPAAFAECCLRLMMHEEERDRLTARAADWVARHHSLASMLTHLTATCDQPARRPHDHT